MQAQRHGPSLLEEYAKEVKSALESAMSVIEASHPPPPPPSISIPYDLKSISCLQLEQVMVEMNTPLEPELLTARTHPCRRLREQIMELMDGFLHTYLVTRNTDLMEASAYLRRAYVYLGKATFEQTRASAKPVSLYRELARVEIYRARANNPHRVRASPYRLGAHYKYGRLMESFGTKLPSPFVTRDAVSHDDGDVMIHRFQNLALEEKHRVTEDNCRDSETLNSTVDRVALPDSGLLLTHKFQQMQLQEEEQAAECGPNVHHGTWNRG